MLRARWLQDAAVAGLSAVSPRNTPTWLRMHVCVLKLCVCVVVSSA